MMQWLVNEFKDFKVEVQKKIDLAVSAWAEKQVEAATRIEKLEGEIRAMKARMGKKEQ